jgi:hypothetical protein
MKKLLFILMPITIFFNSCSDKQNKELPLLQSSWFMVD